jgi:hypothetical protein
MADDKHKAFRVDGSGKTRAVTPATTAAKAREVAQEKRQNLPKGSSTYFEVREPKRGK